MLTQLAGRGRRPLVPAGGRSAPGVSPDPTLRQVFPSGLEVGPASCRKTVRRRRDRHSQPRASVAWGPRGTVPGAVVPAQRQTPAEPLELRFPRGCHGFLWPEEPVLTLRPDHPAPQTLHQLKPETGRGGKDARSSWYPRVGQGCQPETKPPLRPALTCGATVSCLTGQDGMLTGRVRPGRGFWRLQGASGCSLPWGPRPAARRSGGPAGTVSAFPRGPSLEPPSWGTLRRGCGGGAASQPCLCDAEGCVVSCFLPALRPLGRHPEPDTQEQSGLWS